MASDGPAAIEFVFESNTSTDASACVPSKPPTSSTLSFASAAACPVRAAPITASMIANAPVAGSKTSNVAVGTPASSPPATRTRPSGSSVAVCPERANDSAPTGNHAFAAPS